MREQIDESKYRIPKNTAYLMMGTAIFIDVLEMLLTWLAVGAFISPFISLFAGMGFWLWFAIRGVPFLVKPSRFLTLATTFILEIIPGLDALAFLGAFWTFGIFTLITMVRLEDKTGLSLNPAKPKLPGVAGLKNKIPTPRITPEVPTVRPKVRDINPVKSSTAGAKQFNRVNSNQKAA